MGSLPPESLVCATYERVSTNHQAERGFSLFAQAESLEAYAAQHGWLLPDDLRFRDTDSGALWDLPGLQAMLEAARQRRFRVLLVWDLDRFARSLTKALVLEEQLRTYGVRVHYVRMPVDDTPEGRLLKHQLFSIAEYEREKIALRTALGKRQKARNGAVPGGGKPPFGYRWARDQHGRVSGLEPDPETAPYAQELFTLLETQPTEAVARLFEARGVPTTCGGRWSNAAVLAIAKNPVYTGRYTYGRRIRPRDPESWVTIPVPPLISEAQWRRVQEQLAHRRHQRRPAGGADAPYLLQGRLTCAHCGGQLACTENNGVRYYTCLRHFPSAARRQGKPWCPLPPVHAGEVEATAWALVSATLLDREYLAAALAAVTERTHEQARQVAERREAIAREIARQRSRLERVIAERLDAEPGSEAERALRTLASQIEQTIGRLTAELEALAPPDGLTAAAAQDVLAFVDEVTTGLEAATPQERRELFQLLQLRGVVRYDPEHGQRYGRKHRFSIEWDAAIRLQRGDNHSLLCWA